MRLTKSWLVKKVGYVVFCYAFREGKVSWHQWRESEGAMERTLNWKVGDMIEGFLHYLLSDGLREVA